MISKINQMLFEEVLKIMQELLGEECFKKGDDGKHYYCVPNRKNPAKITEFEITIDTDFNKDLGLDSLEMHEFICSVEEALQIVIPDYEIPKMITVKDIVNYLKLIEPKPVIIRNFINQMHINQEGKG